MQKVNIKQVIKDYQKLVSKGRKRFISELARKHNCSRAYIYKVIKSI
jgi:Mor family transcriptional regulator